MILNGSAFLRLSGVFWLLFRRVGMGDIISFLDRQDKDQSILEIGFDYECQLLSSLLCDTGARIFDRVKWFLQPCHFVGGLNRVIYEAICKVDATHGSYNTLHVLNAIKTGDRDQDKTIRTYLIGLVSAHVPGLHALDYGRCVLESWAWRQYHAISRTIEMRAARGLDGTQTTRDELYLLQSAYTDVMAELEQCDSRFNPRPEGKQLAIDLVEKSIKKRQSGQFVRGIGTGYRSLDRFIGGFDAGDLILVGGRPGMGKTAFAVDMAVRAARSGRGVYFHSLEMSHEQLMARILSMITADIGTGIAYSDIIAGRYNEQGEAVLRRAADHISDLPMHISDEGNGGLTTVAAEIKKARKYFAQYDRSLDLVIVDYISLMSTGERYRGNRVLEIAEISRGLKVMAREESLPVVALTQLNRNVEARENKRPNMSDMRDSGSLEQDADAVLFPYRHEYYMKQKSESGDLTPEEYSEWQRSQNKIEIIIAKNRHGETGKTVLNCHMATNTIYEDGDVL
jgi:replicative DNA helicase